MRSILVLFLLLGLAGCQPKPANLRLASSGLPPYHEYEEKVLGCLERAGHQVQRVMSGNLEESAKMVASDKADLTLLPTDLAYRLYGEETPFFKRLRGITTLGRLYLHIICVGDSPPGSIKDLEGNVSIDVNMEKHLTQVLEAADFFTTGSPVIRTRFPDTLLAIQGGEIKATLFFCTLGHPEVTPLLKGDLCFIELENAVISELCRQNPFFSKSKVPPDIYNTQKAMRTVSIPLVLVARENLDGDIAHLLAGAFLVADTDALLPIPLHKSALQYAREKGLLN